MQVIEQKNLQKVNKNTMVSGTKVLHVRFTTQKGTDIVLRPEVLGGETIDHMITLQAGADASLIILMPPAQTRFNL